jgi:hypothetical protein
MKALLLALFLIGAPFLAMPVSASPILDDIQIQNRIKAFKVLNITNATQLCQNMQFN